MSSTIAPMELLREPMSLDEFFQLDDVLVELVDGQPIVSPAPAVSHQRVLMALIRLLLPSLPGGFEVLPAPVDWVLWAGARPTVRQPDLMVVADSVLQGARITQPPLLVVEIVSSSSIERDLVATRRDYARAGAPHYWIVLPDVPEVVCLRLVNGEYVEDQRSVGHQPVALTEPFDVCIVAAALVRTAPDGP